MLLIIILYVLFIVILVTLASHYRAVAASAQETTARETWVRTHCSYCGIPSVSWDGQFCSHECEARLAKSMDDWHDRFEEMDKD